MSKEQAFLHFISVAKRFENIIGEYELTGERRWVINSGRRWPRNLEDGNYVYVVLPETGEVRFSEYPRPKCKIHHSELCNDSEVIGAGLFKLHNGEIICISNESGHYGPDGMSLVFVKAAFEHWQLPLAENLEFDDRWEVFSGR